MRIWTIQNEAAWAFLNEHGYLEAEQKHQSDNWPAAYEWMRNQLIARVGQPPSPDAIPLWGWYQWRDAKRKRPDLRSIRYGWGPARQRYVLLECELADDAVVLSDFDAWHVILNDGYVSISDDDDDAYEAARDECNLHPNDERAELLRRSFYESWERIIDMDALTGPNWFPMEKKSIQACFWKLDLNQVKSVRLFTTGEKQA